MKQEMTLEEINCKIEQIEFALDYGECVSSEEIAEYEELLKLREKYKIKEN